MSDNTHYSIKALTSESILRIIKKLISSNRNYQTTFLEVLKFNNCIRPKPFTRTQILRSLETLANTNTIEISPALADFIIQLPRRTR